MSRTVCPGQDTRFWRPGDIFEVACANCGVPVEFWKDESRRKCPKCGSRVHNPKLSMGCAQWCEHAQECLGHDPNGREVDGDACGLPASDKTKPIKTSPAERSATKEDEMSDLLKNPKAAEKVKIATAQAFAAAGLAEYAPGAVVSREIVKSPAGTVTVFAFDAGQGLSEHTAPFDALVMVLEGEAEIKIGGKPLMVRAGELVVMPANIPHALQAEQRFKMALVMIRG